MSDYEIPNKTQYDIELSDRGAHVYSVQLGLNDLMSNKKAISVDGVFGQKTKNRVFQYQKKYSLYEDGVFGPSSSTKFAQVFCRKLEGDSHPKNILKSVVEGESANLVGAVNWSVPGGVDCGLVQRRLYLPSNEASVKLAWDSQYQIKTLANNLTYIKDAFIDREAVEGNIEKAWRLAVLNHNWPYAANRLANNRVKDLTPYWTEDASWVVKINAHFDDGELVKTPLDWCKFYSLGSKKHNHKGNMVKYVKSWN